MLDVTSALDPARPVRRVYVMRHAKSSWKQADLPDFARPLNGRGRRDAPRMGRLVGEEHGVPDTVFCSAARRAVESYSEMSRAWGTWPELRVDAAFYACSPQVWLEAIAGLPPTARTVMIIGHLPEVYEVLSTLVGPGSAPDRFPTGALAVVEVGSEWSDIGTGRCTLASFQMPRDL